MKEVKKTINMSPNKMFKQLMTKAWLNAQPVQLYIGGIHSLTYGWTVAAQRDGEFVK